MKNESGIRFQMIGDGLFKNAFVEEAQARGLDNIDFYPLQPVDIVPDVYSACDIEIIPLRKGVIGNGVPSKAPLLMACHKTIINSVEKESAYYHLFNDNKMGISVPLDDAEALANAIRKLAADPELCRKMADRAKEYSHKFYSASVCTKNLWMHSMRWWNDDKITDCWFYKARLYALLEFLSGSVGESASGNSCSYLA